jgi:hypothetical protein
MMAWFPSGLGELAQFLLATLTMGVTVARRGL